MLAIILPPGIQLRLFLKMQEAAGFFIPGRLQTHSDEEDRTMKKILIAEDEDVIRDFVVINPPGRICGNRRG